MYRLFLFVAMSSILPNWLYADLRLGVFEVDATPAIGSPLAYDPMREATLPLSCRGVVLTGEQQPIVICCVDWLGIANDSADLFRNTLAQAVNTSVNRVVVHTLHQHDAPRCDLTAAKILGEYGQAAAHYDVPFIKDVVSRAGLAAAQAAKEAQTVTSISTGVATVENVASNRRLLGPDGKVHTTRYTACKDPAIRDLPVGVIDPQLKLLAFEGTRGPIAAITFYATHPQSYYRTGGANPDFPGMARNSRQSSSGVFHLHLNGAGGNIGAGKYNDGSHENRQVLAERVAAAMKLAFDNRQTSQLESVDWSFRELVAPLAEHLNEAELTAAVADDSTPYALRGHAAEKLAFLQRTNAGIQLQVSRLRIGANQILFMPGELFVEYQLAAQHMAPDSNVMLAAYGEYGTQYIGTRVAYDQGGYETSDRATNVSPRIEGVLTEAMRDLLAASDRRLLPSDYTERTGALPKRD
ncbi:MAG: hypothetical protein KDB22_01335 [Planctomycetales bacterium]|nr:hypothetical protein [Planctomycetales bacterium]